MSAAPAISTGEALEALTAAAWSLLADCGEMMSREATRDAPAEFVATHLRGDELALRAAMNAARATLAETPAILTAAGDLLRAIEALMLPLQAAVDDGCRIDPRDMPATLALARRAIAKARGQRELPDNPFDGRGAGMPA